MARERYLGERGLSRRRFLKIAAASIPTLCMSGSDISPYERFYLEHGEQVMDFVKPPSEAEIATFAEKKQKQVHMPFESEVTDTSAGPLSVKYIKTHTADGTNHGFVLSSVPWGQVKKGEIYYHSLGGPAFDLQHWDDDFSQKLGEGTAFIIPLARQKQLAIGGIEAVSGGLATDAKPADSLRIIHTALQAEPKLKKIPWDVVGVSMGGSIGYSEMQWWDSFAKGYELPEQLETVSLYAPYASVMRAEILTDVLRADPAAEPPGLPLVLKWAIQDESQSQRASMLPLERLLAMDTATKNAFRQRVMNVSPGYHAIARQYLDETMPQVRYRLSYSGLDPVVPPSQTLASSALLEQSAKNVEVVKLPGFHCMFPWDKKLLQRM